MGRILTLLQVSLAALCALGTSSCRKDISGTDSNATILTVSSDATADYSEKVADFELNWDQEWNGIVGKDMNAQFLRGTRSQIPVRRGNYAGRFMVRPGDVQPNTSGERCEAIHYNDRVYGYNWEMPNDEYYYGWSTYFPADWKTPAGWAIFAQWKHRAYALPPIAFNIGNNTIGVQFYTGLLKQMPSTWYANYTYNSAFTILNSVAKGVWHDFIVRIRFKPDNTGIFQVWHKLQSEKPFTMVFSRTNIPTMQIYKASDWPALDTDNHPRAPDNKVPWGSYVTTQMWSTLGLYRAPANFTNVIYHDNSARATWFTAISNNFY